MVKLINMWNCREHISAKMNACNLLLFLYAVLISGSKLTTASYTVNDTTSSYMEVSSKFFSEKLVSEWGSDGVIDAVQLGQILERLGIDETVGEKEKSNVSSTMSPL